MKKHFYSILSIVLGLLCLQVKVYASTPMPPTVATPWTWSVTSSFGPRDPKYGSYFHKGIDYCENNIAGSAIKAVESGPITLLNYNESKGWLIEIHNRDSHHWAYWHMFPYCCESTSTGWGVRWARQVNLADSTITSSYVIIKWKTINQKAERILSTKDSYKVLNPDGVTYIQNESGNDILTSGRVSARSLIGPVGNTGNNGLPVHLHVELNNGDNNPLYYLTHGNHGYAPKADARFTIPADSVSVSPLDDLKYRFKADINTNIIPSNYDLDKVEFLIDGNLQSANDSRTGSVMQSKFVFGGMPAGNPPDPNRTLYPSWISDKNYMSLSDATTGVHPLDAGSSKPTNFRFIWNADLCNLPPGGHRFTVKAVDVNGYITTNGTDFTVGVIVPDDYSTIQSAIDDACDCGGQTIIVRDGTYYENINFHGKAVTLRSENGAGSAIINGGGHGSVVTFANLEMYSSVLG